LSSCDSKWLGRILTDIHIDLFRCFDLAKLRSHSEVMGSLKIIIMLFSSIIFNSCVSAEKIMINDAPVVCDKEAYNCPSYKGPYQNKRLKSCKDVMLVWKTCKSDVHDLDRDGDGKPCEEDCG
jgi:hypothetical protein